MVAISGSTADGVDIAALHDTVQRRSFEVSASLHAELPPEDFSLLGPLRHQIAVWAGNSMGQLRNTAGHPAPGGQYC